MAKAKNSNALKALKGMVNQNLPISKEICNGEILVQYFPGNYHWNRFVIYTKQHDNVNNTYSWKKAIKCSSTEIKKIINILDALRVVDRAIEEEI